MWYTYAARLLKFKVLFGNNFYINQLISQSLLGSGGKTVNSYPGSNFFKKQLDDNENIISSWIVHGNLAFNHQKQCSAILKFACNPSKEVKDFIQSLGLKWNKLKGEWRGNIKDVDSLKDKIKDTDHELKLLK